MQGLLVVVAVIAAYIGYVVWLGSGIKPRHISTTLGADALRSLFEQKVARAGWKLVDTGNPMVAQSSLATGIRQQIGLEVTSVGDRTDVVIAPHRLVRKLTGVPTKAHTLRLRLNSFAAAVQAEDRSAVVVKR